MTIATRAQTLKVTALAQFATSIVLADPAVPMIEALTGSLQSGPDHEVVLELHSATNSIALQISATDALTHIARRSSDEIASDLMAGAMMLGAVQIGDLIHRATNGPSPSALIQFARHFRNACAHGDRWHFAAGEPRTRAATRRVELNTQMAGHRATLATVGPLEYIEFLDEVSAHFTTATLRAVLREVLGAHAGAPISVVRRSMASQLSAAGYSSDDMDQLIYLANEISAGELPKPVIKPMVYPLHL